MAVHTKLSQIQVKKLLSDYNIGEFTSYAEIKQGIENSNYFIQTSQSKYILTIFERRVKDQDLPFFLKLMKSTQNAGVDCPTPIVNKQGEYLGFVKKKKFAFFKFLEGSNLKYWNQNDCFLVGKKISDFHIANKNFEIKKNNDFGINQFLSLFYKIEEGLEIFLPGLKENIKKEIIFLKKKYPRNVSCGIIHADLFPDNILFFKKNISGIIDFYFSCYDYFIYDLSIAINAWCFPNNKFDQKNYKSLMKGYLENSYLSDEEFSNFNIFLRAAAMRFLLTRLSDIIFPTSNSAEKKDPKEFFNILNFHRINDITKE